MNKLYDRIDFVNNTNPALNETNLNALSKAVDDIDDRVIDIAGDVLVVVPEILDKYADIEALATNPPYIGNNGHWWTWDTDLNQYVDSGVDAGVSLTVGTTTTLPAGSSATVTNSGTATDPVLNFGIPQGIAGQDGQDGQDGADGQDGVSPEVTITTITGGHEVTITDADHPAGQSFNVMDGQDGAAGVGVPAGGTTSQVLKKKSGTDFDTEWANESGGGGHTIINSSGASMTQRAGLQFEGMGVTDDSTNDKTVVTPPTPDYVDEQYSSSTTYSKGDTCISGNVRYRYINSTASSGHQPPNATYWEVLSVADELAVTCINNDSTTINGISYYKSGKMRMLTIGNGGNRTVNDLSTFLTSNVPTDEHPKTNVATTLQLITLSGNTWSMEMGSFVLYAKTNPNISSRYILYKSGEEIPHNSSLVLSGQIVWFTE